MFFSKLAFFVNEAFTSLRRSLLTTFITISTIAISLILMGAFLFTTMNLEVFLHKLQSEALVTVYMTEDTSFSDAGVFKSRLSEMPEIDFIKVVSPEEAAKELFATPDEQKLLQIGVTPVENPLPITVRIRLKDPSKLKYVVEKLKHESLVDNLSYGEELFSQFSGMSALLWYVSLSIVLLLGLCSMFIVYNTVRMTLYMRREEILIMKLVGATDWFVRGPFVVEGFVEGLLASVIATAVLLGGYHFVSSKLSELIPFFGTGLTFSQLFKLSTKLFMMGLVLGVVGSLLSLRDIKDFSKYAASGV